jgi:signal transduction histidine kinase
VQSLASRISLPVTADVTGHRLPPAIEATAYFVVSEALTNAAKHSGADRSVVRVHVEGGVLRIEVCDDGIGGAELDAGTGLLGLHDRVVALDGRMQIENPPGGGTRIVATLPLPGQ